MLNPKAIAQLREIDAEGSLLQEIIELYLRDTPPRIAEILRESGAGNFKRVAEISHSLRSSSGYLGATDMQTLSSELEEFALKNNNIEVNARVARIESVYQSTEKELRALIVKK